jgi:hypothetical protein
MMMNEDYRKGFKDGFELGLEEGKKQQKISVDLEKYLQKPLTFPQYDVRETCPKCGVKISGVMGYVCNSPNCPTFLQVSCGTPMTGAVGSEVSYTYAKEANGPAGYVEPKKQYDDRGWRIK